MIPPIPTPIATCAFVVAAFCAACEHPPPPASPWQSTAILAPAPALALRHAPLAADIINDLHRGLALLEGSGSAAAILLAGAATLDEQAMRESAGARTLAIAAIYHTVQSRGLGAGFAQVRKLVDRMYAVAPKAPETRFALAYLRWFLLSDGVGGLRLADLEPKVAEDLLHQLDVLRQRHPTFDGPGIFDRHRIAAEAEAVRAMLARLPEAATATAPAVAATGTAAP